jgi:hypothetical protein
MGRSGAVGPTCRWEQSMTGGAMFEWGRMSVGKVGSGREGAACGRLPGRSPPPNAVLGRGSSAEGGSVYGL